MPKTASGGPPGIPLSNSTSANGFVFVSGQVPTSGDGSIPEGIEAQTRIILDKIKQHVEAAGGSLDDIVKTTVFLVRVEDFAAMNAIYAEYFPNDPPARSTLRCELMIDILVEIEAIAAI